MWVIDLENAPPRIRGRLSRWGVEVRAGLYVGSTSAKARDAIWELVEKESGAEGNAVLVYDTSGPQGFEVRTHGPNRREIVDADGLWLAKFLPKMGDAEEPATVPDAALQFNPADFDPEYMEP